MSQLKRSTKRDNGDPLTDYIDEYWYGSITVGTPAVNYTGGSPLRHWQITVTKINRVAYSGY